MSHQYIIYHSIRGVKINSIRVSDEMPGLRDYEVSLLKLVDKVTNGSKVSINETGTSVSFIPGQLTGGKISHECSISRSVVYYLEVVAALAPFCKDPLILQLKGSTHESIDNSVDIFRSVTVPLLAKLGVANNEEAKLSFKIVTRSCREASGIVIFTSPTVKFLAPLDLVKEGLVKRVRGVFWSSKMNREFSVRFVESARSVLNKCIEDVWIYSENVTNTTMPCIGASIMSETDYGYFKGVCALETDPALAETLGKAMGQALLKEIDLGGICDQSHQWLVCLFMALAQDHKVSTCTIGSELSASAVEFIRYVQTFLLVRFNVTRKPEGPIQLECIGVNLANTARRTI